MKLRLMPARDSCVCAQRHGGCPFLHGTVSLVKSRPRLRRSRLADSHSAGQGASAPRFPIGSLEAWPGSGHERVHGRIMGPSEYNFIHMAQQQLM